ncbi:MAG: amidohydrolase family protein [Methanosarcinaceae archaeon]|nr:amidohydrolase family protein [Methanosarcinaceae archaeon]
MIIDCHTHIFPSRIAQKAAHDLVHLYGSSPVAGVTAAYLSEHMDHCGVDRSVILPVATTPDQVRSINTWILSLLSDCDRFIGLGAMHPDFNTVGDVETVGDELERLKKAGIRGVKLHPEFQFFYPDEDRMFRLYEAFIEHDMLAFFHAGGGGTWLKEIHGTPERFEAVLDSFPKMKVLAAHFGGYDCWVGVEKHLLGRDILFDTAYIFRSDDGTKYLPDDEIVRMVEAQGSDKILFGTDYPFRRQDIEIANLIKLDLDDSDKERILGENAAQVFGV